MIKSVLLIWVISTVILTMRTLILIWYVRHASPQNRLNQWRHRVQRSRHEPYIVYESFIKDSLNLFARKSLISNGHHVRHLRVFVLLPDYETTKEVEKTCAHPHTVPCGDWGDYETTERERRLSVKFWRRTTPPSCQTPLASTPHGGPLGSLDWEVRLTLRRVSVKSWTRKPPKIDFNQQNRKNKILRITLEHVTSSVFTTTSIANHCAPGNHPLALTHTHTRAYTRVYTYTPHTHKRRGTYFIFEE